MRNVHGVPFSGSAGRNSWWEIGSQTDSGISVMNEPQITFSALLPDVVRVNW